MLANRGLHGIRPLVGLMQLLRKHGRLKIENACSKALSFEAYHLRNVRNLIESDAEQVKFSFLEEHPLIRPVDFYGKIVKAGNSDNSL